MNIQIYSTIMEKNITNRFISRLVKDSLKGFFVKAFPAIVEKENDLNILLQNGPKNQCQYVSPSAIKYFNMNKGKEKNGTAFGCKSVEEFANRIIENFQKDEIIKEISSHDKGFLRIKLNDKLVEDQVNSMMESLEFPESKKEKVVIDFSSPNIAKEMHVGHLRSTIIGESMCRVLEYMGNEVRRANHLGDWGTQFGMLIAYMEETYPDYQNNPPQIKDLDSYYKAARARFDSDAEFKKKSQQTVVRLQAYDQSCIKAWKSFCEISRNYFSKIYQRLNVHIEEFGESFYNPMIPETIKMLDQLGLIVEDDTVTKKGVKGDKKGGKKKGKEVKEMVEDVPEEKVEEEEVEGKQKRKAKCIFIEKYPIPLMVVKSDGGYGYDTTDLSAIRYRIFNQKADRMIYVTDLGQREHFQMVFAAARKAGWLQNQRTDHMGFGVVLEEAIGEDGKKIKRKFSTRKGVAVKLMDLLDEAKQKALAQLKSREKEVKQGEEDGEGKEQVYTALKPEEYEDAAQKLGVAGIKYYDLKQNRTSDYVFDFDKILDPRGNTAVYLIYAYVRMCSIIRKSGLSSEQISDLCFKNPFVVTHPDERILAGMLVKFFDVIYEAADEMQINRLTDYIYEIAVKIQENYKKYRIVGDQNMHSRIILCECIRRTLLKAFLMVGIVPIQKI